MESPCHHWKASDLELGNELAQPLTIWAKPDVPTSSFAVSQWLRYPLADVVLHECNDPVTFPAQYAERESDIRYNRGALRDVRDGNGEDVKWRLACTDD